MISNAEQISRIKRALKAKGITMQTLSASAGIPYRTVQNYLYEKRKLSLDGFSKIATALDLSADIASAVANDGSYNVLPDGNDVVDRLRITTDTQSDLQLAEFLSVSKQAIAAWRKRGTVSIEACTKVAQAKGVTLDYLIIGKPDAGAVSEIAQDYCAKDHGRIDAVLFDECWHVACDLSQSIECSRDLALRTYNARVTADDLTASLSVRQIAAVIHAADRERSGPTKRA